MTDSPETKKTTVLLVDNDPGILRLLQKTLERSGYQVVATHDGNEALSLHKRNIYDVLVVDHMVEPIIMGDEGLIKTGTVMLKKG